MPRARNARRPTVAARDTKVGKLPGKCFLSHSYQDAAALAALQEFLPAHVERVIFPREEPQANRAVSDGIVPRILECGTLIYLQGGRSRTSRWVRFERDFALRAKKHVYSFDPARSRLQRDNGEPVALRVQVLVSTEQEARTRTMLAWMREHRHFDITDVKPVRRMKEIQGLAERLCAAQKLVVWLLDAQTAAVAALLRENVDSIKDYFVDDMPEGWWPPPMMFARIDPDWAKPTDADPDIDAYIRETDARRFAIDLVEGVGGNDLNWNRVDDLIVQLTLRLTDLPPIDDEWTGRRGRRSAPGD
jgi:hypothetical protein